MPVTNFHRRSGKCVQACGNRNRRPCRAGRGSVAFGAIPGADGVIKGCYDNSGYVKVIDSAVTCNAGSTPISWNQKGPKGDGSVHRGVFDKAATYSVGDVVYDPATSYNVCGTVAKDRPAGSYVKIKAGTDKWQQGDPATSSIYSPCMVPDMWALMAPRGEKGQKGDADPNNLYWARLSADGKLLAKNAPVQYFGNWGPGRALAPSRDTKSAAPGPRARAARQPGRHTGAGRIAHALHEVVAHNISLIVAQAQALGATVRPTAMHCSVLRTAVVPAAELRTPAREDDQASAGARSAPAWLLHRWKGSSVAVAIEFHAAER